MSQSPNKLHHNYIEIRDSTGCRHYVRMSTIQWISDVDTCRDEALLTAAGRTVHLLCSLDQLIETIESTTGGAQRAHVRPD